MTTLEIIDTVGSWKLGGTYEDESPANAQLRILNMVNLCREKVLIDYYAATRQVPQVCYQEFDITASWTNESGCLSFVAEIPQVMTFPSPKMNGWDSIVPVCEKAMPLTEVESVNQLRSLRNNSIGKRMRTSGWYLTTNNQLSGFLKPLVKADGLVGRAVLVQPQLAQGFNTEKDIYPFPDGMIPNIQEVLTRNYARMWAMANNMISNSKSQIENVGRK